jgi:hypothetical protein
MEIDVVERDSVTPNFGLPDESSVTRALRFCEPRVSFGLLILGLCLTVSSSLAAQVVRGVVREGESGAPLAGVLVALDDAGSGPPDGTPGRPTLLAVLSNERGEFVIAAGRRGRFVLSAKRIGARRYVSPPMTLADGETRQLDVTLEQLRYDLPVVTVTTTSPCPREPNDSRRIASLWDETRVALSATQISLRDRLFKSTITRYTRSLRAQGMRVLHEETSVLRGVSQQPFVSMSAESLSAEGYTRDDLAGTIYYAPDAAVLLSDSFVREHCFSIVAGRGKRSNLIGLAFEPAPQRRLADIRGTMWLDARTFELRLVDFRYVNIELPVDDPRIGGEVHFTRLESGAWIVSRWFIRMPDSGEGSVGTISGPSLPYTKARVSVVRFREEGGDVAVEDAASTGVALRRLVSLEGRVADSTGRTPLRGAVVRVSGTRHATTVLPDGSFRLDSLPSGSYTLVVEHPAYTLLGIPAAEQDLTIEDEGLSQTYIRALGSEQLLRMLCGKEEVLSDEGALRVVLRESATGALVADAEVRLSWLALDVSREGSVAKTRRTVVSRTDERGSVTFCKAPAQTTLQLDVPRTDRSAATSQTVKLEAGGVVALEVRR